MRLSKDDIDKMLNFVYNRHTEANYRSALIPFIGVSLTPEAIQKVVIAEWLGLSESTIKVRRAAIGRLIKYLAAEGKCQAGVLRRVTFPDGRPPQQRRALTTAETQAFVSAAETLDEKLLTAILFDTGLRIGFVPNITYADLNEGSFELHMKGNRKLEIHTTDGIRLLGGRLMNALGADASQYIFTAGGDRVTYKKLRSIFMRVASRAGIKGITPHSARHTFATRLSESGVQIGIISELMGHCKLETTMAYLHHNRDEMRNAVLTNAITRRQSW